MFVGLMLAELVMSGNLWAGKNVADIDIIIKKKPGGSNMFCMHENRPCNQDQVRQLAPDLRRNGVNLSLAEPDGRLSCTTENGKLCTDEHVSEVQAVAKRTHNKAIGSKGISGN